MLVHQLIYRGDQDNIVFHGPAEVTYRQLRGEVARYRDYLFSAGVRPGENVGLFIRNTPGVGEAAVIGVSDELRGQTVRAYLAMKDGQPLDKKALKAYLREKLAAYKIPRDFIQLDALPKNAAGKILKRLLREQQGL